MNENTCIGCGMLNNENISLVKEIELLQSRLEEITDASAIVLTESLRYQEVLHAIMEAGPASPGDKKHLMAQEALEGIIND